MKTLGLKTRCNLNIRKFPFDQQKCEIQIGSWQHVDSEIKIGLWNRYKKAYTVNFMANSVWDLIGNKLYIVNTSSRFFGYFSSSDFVFELTVKRKPLYYMINNVYPCLILNLVTLITYFLPFILQANLSNLILKKDQVKLRIIFNKILFFAVIE